MIISSRAMFSDDRVYRYELSRINDTLSSNQAIWCGVNPSKAGETQEDPTSRIVNGFTERWGFGSSVLLNKFAFVSTDVRGLVGLNDPVGPRNDARIGVVMASMIPGDVFVAAWGPLAKLPKSLRNRWREIVSLARERDVTIMCLGTTQDGQPRHPLMVSYTTPLQAWNPPL